MVNTVPWPSFPPLLLHRHIKFIHCSRTHLICWDLYKSMALHSKLCMNKTLAKIHIPGSHVLVTLCKMKNLMSQLHFSSSKRTLMEAGFYRINCWIQSLFSSVPTNMLQIQKYMFVTQIGIIKSYNYRLLLAIK